MNAAPTGTQPKVMLRAESAADLMSPNPISISDRATLPEAVDLMIRKGFHAAPVIDDAGQPVGVLSGTDILIHLREKAKRGNSAAAEDTAVAREMMTPAVFSISAHASADRVVDDMVALGVHQLFVVDEAGVLVGVISALDVVRHLAK